ncbi:MAG: hypothetical protein J2O49_11075 [Sciscionella sp.]|nr:hypothetical protein [Sciscionella sp.]
MSTIVVITAEGDLHVPPVAERLPAGVELTAIDTAQVFDGQSLSYRYRPGDGTRVYHRDRELADVIGVWYRKPLVLGADSMPVADDYKQYALSGWEAFCRCLPSQFPDAVWVSDYHAIERGRCKAGQLRLADAVGFDVPTTLITSSPDAAREFVDAHGVCVVKPLAVRSPAGKVVYTTRIRRGQELNFAGLVVDPLIFQVCVDPVRELRVTVVGERVFTAEVSGGDAEFEVDVRDWRADAGRGRFRARETRLPADLEHRCVQYLKLSGLNFGAFDFIVDADGVHWFLECNPNGQWLFVQDATGMPISTAMAELLTGRAL